MGQATLEVAVRADRASKWLTCASVPLLCGIAWSVSPGVSGTMTAGAIGALALFAFCARRWRTGAFAVWCAGGPLMPASLAALSGRSVFSAWQSLWLLAGFVLLLPAARRDGWGLPAGMRGAASFWALILTLLWPVLLVREAGPDLSRLYDEGAIGGYAMLSIPQVESWIAFSTVAPLMGLLFFEWIIDHPWSITLLRRALCGGVAVCSAVAVYQGSVDLSALSLDPWPGLRRAASTLHDANAYGALAAMMLPIMWLDAKAMTPGHARLWRALGLVTAGGIWMSGSRTAALLALFGVTGLMVCDARPAIAGLRRWTTWVVASVWIGVVASSGALGPLARAVQGLHGTPDTTLEEMWRRTGYGPVAVAMIREFPLAGVGVGTFNVLAPDYGREVVGRVVPFDNAQNWWRHQVAELGVLGVWPCLLLSLASARLVLRTVATTRELDHMRFTSAVVLLGFGVVSCVGIPTQHPVVLIAFALLLASLCVPQTPAPATLPGRRTKCPLWPWLGLASLVAFLALHLGPTRRALGPVARAQRFQREFVSGAYAPELDSQGKTFRWTSGTHATVFLPGPAREVVLAIAIQHPDAAEHPVALRVSSSAGPLLDKLQHDATPQLLQVNLPSVGAIFDVEVSRTWRPVDFGSEDSRSLGARIELED